MFWHIPITLCNFVESFGKAQESSFLCGSWMWLTRKLNYFDFRMNPHVCVCMYVCMHMPAFEVLCAFNLMCMHVLYAF